MQDFDKIYSEYYSVVYKYVFTLCHDSIISEEVTQETFFKALKNIGNFKGECKIHVWLCQIAKNTLFTLVESSKRKSELPLDIFQSNDNLEQNLLDQETAFLLHKILHKLDEPYKEVFWMRTFGELSFAQIAALFGKTESWARVTYHRAKIKIKEEIQ